MWALKTEYPGTQEKIMKSLLRVLAGASTLFCVLVGDFAPIKAGSEWEYSIYNDNPVFMHGISPVHEGKKTFCPGKKVQIQTLMRPGEPDNCCNLPGSQRACNQGAYGLLIQLFR
jgi:hypothetical protein